MNSQNVITLERQTSKIKGEKIFEEIQLVCDVNERSFKKKIFVKLSQEFLGEF